ncbi:MAG: hypothetical protein CBB70_15175 [Planctomycetaceae bacterium TMED10]|nr:MAG: hypothetical protein CBB70_15175 [Planctomycetaceae bacterium TMED10]
MCEPTGDHTQKPGNGLHYLIAFLCFAIVALALASGKINQRQRAIEQQYHGIQQMQRGPQGASADTNVDSENAPQAISTRPLMWLLVAPLVVAWLLLLWRRYRSIRNASHSE